MINHLFDKEALFSSYIELLSAEVEKVEAQIEVSADQDDEVSFNRLREESLGLMSRLSELKAFSRDGRATTSEKVVDLSIVEVQKLGTDQFTYYFILPVAGAALGKVLQNERNVTICGRDHRLYGQKVGYEFSQKGKMIGYDTLATEPRHFQIAQIL